MKSKEELIEIMRNAHQDCLCNADGTVEEAWEAAYQALRNAETMRLRYGADVMTNELRWMVAVNTHKGAKLVDYGVVDLDEVLSLPSAYTLDIDFSNKPCSCSLQPAKTMG